MTDVTIRLHYLRSDGSIEDAQEDYGLESFAGMLPAIGDDILAPGVPSGRDRSDPDNRVVWTVARRIFNARDLENYVALVVEQRSAGGPQDAALVP